MALPKKKRPVTNKAHLQTTCLIGVPKIGKSTFGSDMPDPLFFAFEDGCRALEVFITPEDGTLDYTWDMFLNDLRELRGKVQKGDCLYGTVVIDTIDLAVDACRKFMLDKYSAVHESDLDWGKGWRIVEVELARVIAAIKRLGLGVLLITHQDDKEVTSFDGKKHQKGTTTLSKTGRAIVFGLSDVILYATMERDPESGKWRRVIKTKPGRDYEAGGRYPRGGEGMPRTLPLDWKCFADAFTNGLTEERLLSEYGFATRRLDPNKEQKERAAKPPQEEATGDPLGADLPDKTAEPTKLQLYADEINDMSKDDLNAEWAGLAKRMKYDGDKPKTLRQAKTQLCEWYEKLSAADEAVDKIDINEQPPTDEPPPSDEPPPIED